jgi:hypothetical protein
MPSNEYMAKYMAERRQRRRQELITILGGICARCDVTIGLEFDHKDSTAKSFTLSGKDLDKPWAELLAEAQKCQLLCHPHHREKTKECGETGGGWNKNLHPQVHGTTRCYQETGCKCSPCRLAKRMYRNKEVDYAEVVV